MIALATRESAAKVIMMGTIKVMPNQSMADVILQGCGSLAAGMQFCKDNDLSISDYPDVGTIYKISDEAINTGDTTVLQYLEERGLVIGTLGAVPVLGFSLVLKPVMHVLPKDPNPPWMSGFYSYNLLAAPGFINLHPIAGGDYISLNNIVSYETEERIIAGIAPATAAQDATSLVMAAKIIPYKMPWFSGRGFHMVWSDLGTAGRTVTFADTAGNQAYVSPLIVLDSITQAVEEYLIADILVELVSAAHNTVSLRLTRSHTPVAHADFATHVMSWLHDAVGGSSDPSEPANADKTIVTLSRGSYTFGVGTVYHNGAYVYPASAFSMVVEVS